MANTVESDSRVETDGQHASDGHRALVVVNEAVTGAELRNGLIERLGKEIDEVFVVAPALSESTLGFALGDIDEAVGPARERLSRTLKELNDAGVSARGEVGDSDPMQALQDEMVKFGPDQVLVVAHSDEESGIAERGLLNQAERDLELPVTELVVDKQPQPHVLDVKRTKGGAGRGRGWRPSYNWPPLTRRNLFGILVAVIGTIAIGILASLAVGNSNGVAQEESRLDTAAAAAILIATAIALINLAHVVGLFLFQSVGYDGLFSRFISRISLIGTPIALVAVIILNVIE
jgi:hypothetical protein